MKKRQERMLSSGCTKKSDCVRKLFACFVVGSLLWSPAAFAQTMKKVTLQFKKAKLENVLAVIKEQTGVHLIYSDEDVADVAPVSIQVKEMDVMEAINRCLEGTGLSITVKDGTIVISPATQ